MKKYFLFLSILVLTLFSPGIVKAENENVSCSQTKNLIDNNFHFGWHDSSGTSTSTALSNDMFISVTPGENITFSSNNQYLSLGIFNVYNSSFQSSGSYSLNSVSSNNNIYYSTFIIPDNIYYIRFQFYNRGCGPNCFGLTPEKFQSGELWLQLEKGDTYTEHVEYDCTIPEPEPEEPIEPDNPSDNPSVEESEQSKILQNFYILFLDRLKFISDYAINNYLFLAFIGIILIFVILEIFLYLYNKGGYK